MTQEHSANYCHVMLCYVMLCYAEHKNVVLIRKFIKKRIKFKYFSLIVFVNKKSGLFHQYAVLVCL
jgi:hypothetical protein